MSGQGRQAKVLSDAQARAALGHVDSSSRYADRGRCLDPDYGMGRNDAGGLLTTSCAKV